LSGYSRDPKTNRILRYIMLQRNFGGSIEEWKNMKERDLQYYMTILNALIRKKQTPSL